MEACLVRSGRTVAHVVKYADAVEIAKALATPVPADGEVREDFLRQLRRVNTDRYTAWAEGSDAGIMFDALELGGEVGELLNVVKKLEREERGWRGSRANPQDFADECGDVLICLDKLARRRGVDLAEATAAKFNATSVKVGLPHMLATAPTPPASPSALVEEMAEAAQNVVDRMSGTYTARNGREVGIQGDDGEKCWIVHSDDVERLRAALAKYDAAKGSRS
jgi:NTP pyrophosphatase (non-canonical NTP hydrolase)